MQFRNQGVREAFERRIRAGLAAIGEKDPEITWQGIDPEEPDVIVYSGGLSITETGSEPGVFIAEQYGPVAATRWEPEGGDLIEVGRYGNPAAAASGFVALYAQGIIERAIEASDEDDYAKELSAAPR